MTAIPGQTKPGTRCRRASCRAQYAAHAGEACPGLEGLKFQAHVHRGASQSFSEAEVVAFERVVKALLAQQWREALVALRTPGGNALMRKFQVMRESLARRGG
jgi:hypothetical protein